MISAEPYRECSATVLIKMITSEHKQFDDREAAALTGVAIAEYGLPLRREIAAVIRRRRPDMVITPTPDPRTVWGGVDFADCRVVGLAGVDAARDASPESGERFGGRLAITYELLG